MGVQTKRTSTPAPGIEIAPGAPGTGRGNGSHRTSANGSSGSAHEGGARTAMATAKDYVALTKPRIISLLLLTTLATMFVADPAGPALSTILWTMLGGYLAAGGAGAINHYLERERDSRVDRTSKRPIASGRIRPGHGLAFGIALGVAAVVQLALTVNPLSAALAATGLLGYVFVYTLWLKPRTPQNIVLGGAAGAIPPLVGWAAATGALTAQALWPFAIVFFWTPPHFWALSLLIADDYAKTGVPMLPVVRGERDEAEAERQGAGQVEASEQPGDDRSDADRDQERGVAEDLVARRPLAANHWQHRHARLRVVIGDQQRQGPEVRRGPEEDNQEKDHRRPRQLAGHRRPADERREAARSTTPHDVLGRTPFEHHRVAQHVESVSRQGQAR